MCPVCVANAALIEAAHCALDEICVTSNDAFKQISAVDLSTVANIATALTVRAVVFGLIEMRRTRKEREERAAFVAVQAILTPPGCNQ